MEYLYDINNIRYDIHNLSTLSVNINVNDDCLFTPFRFEIIETIVLPTEFMIYNYAGIADVKVITKTIKNIDNEYLITPEYFTIFRY